MVKCNDLGAEVYKPQTATPAGATRCPKCSSQCEGQCPMPGSPHYDSLADRAFASFSMTDRSDQKHEIIVELLEAISDVIADTDSESGAAFRDLSYNRAVKLLSMLKDLT